MPTRSVWMSPAWLACVVWMLAVPLARAQQEEMPDYRSLVPEVRAPEGDLRVLVWNVQRGANNFTHGAEKTMAWIEAIDPDVVLMQESYDVDGDRPTLGRWIASELGWDHHQGESPHLCVISPLRFKQTYFHEAWHAIGARLEDSEGRQFVAYSIWIDYRAYTPYALRDNPDATDAELLANETTNSGRLNQAANIVEHLREIGHLGGPDDPGGALPLLVGGDWNCPSHLDWTEDAAIQYRYRRPLPLPVSSLMHAAGFEDAFRAVHPSAVRVPGITWSPLYRGSVEAPETADRIDRLYTLGAAPEGEAEFGVTLRPVEAFTLPLELEDLSIEQADRLFPSDHGAVVIDLVWDHVPEVQESEPTDP